MTGNRDEALRLMRAADEVLLDVGDLRASVGQEAAIVEVLCGIPDAAEARLRAAFEQLEAMGEKALLADTAAMLARVLVRRRPSGRRGRGLCRRRAGRRR